MRMMVVKIASRRMGEDHSGHTILFPKHTSSTFYLHIILSLSLVSQDGEVLVYSKKLFGI